MHGERKRRRLATEEALIEVEASSPFAARAKQLNEEQARRHAEANNALAKLAENLAASNVRFELSLKRRGWY